MMVTPSDLYHFHNSFTAGKYVKFRLIMLLHYLRKLEVKSVHHLLEHMLEDADTTHQLHC